MEPELNRSKVRDRGAAGGANHNVNNSTLHQGYTQLVDLISKVSQDHSSKAEAVSSQVVEALRTLEKGNDDLKKKVVFVFL